MFSANRIGTPASGSANCAVICSNVGWGSPGVCSSGLHLTHCSSGSSEATTKFKSTCAETESLAFIPARKENQTWSRLNEKLKY